jgi:transposase InsO family protein
MVKVILRSLVFLNPMQVQLIRGDPRYTLMSPEEVIGKFVSFELMINGSKKIVEQGTSSTPEAQPVAFKATEEKKEESTSSRPPIDASKLDNEEIALIIKSFRQILKQRRGKDYKSRSKKVCYKCGKPGHFIAKCPLSSDSDRDNDKKGKRREKKRYYKKNLHKILKGEHILGLRNVHFEKDRICRACLAGKQVDVHHPHKNIITTDRPLELLHMDLCGPIAYISIGGSKYCLVIVDDYSRFTWVFFLQEKSQTQETLKGFLRRAQNEFGLRIKKIRGDNRMEFKNSQIKGFLEVEGIKHEFSSPYTPQQNGVVERKNRNLLDMARTMLDEYKTSDRFWAEAVNTACYTINRLYLHRILKKTSYELLTGKKPNVSYFRVFGSKCFILVKIGRKSKFAPKAVEGFLLGYDSNTRAYRVFNKSSGLVEVSCDIVFDETNGSQVEQVDLDELDDEEAPCIALRNMSIGDVCPKESEEPPNAQDQPSSSMQASPPTQDEDEAQDVEGEE